MSFESVAIAMNHSKATGTARLVLYGIASHDGDGGAWPAISTLQRYAGGVDKRTVQRAVEQLERLGEVRRIIQQGGDHSMADHRRPNLYRFLLRCPHDCDRTSSHRTGQSVSVMLPDELSTRVAYAPPDGADAGGGGGADATQTIHKNLITKVKETSSSTGARDKAACGHPQIPGTEYCEYGCAASMAIANQKQVSA
jgi:hypothetical protein